ncbi:FAD-binding oxidoreductase [uncultured Enterovirga sp.]|uniref:FAD-binding oxidoreductase n=1 Tax=uncultured Enterovirga sp. TaxID=2026352 RepID=UPI0035C9F399
MSAADGPLLDAFAQVVGPANVVDPETAARDGHFTDWRKLVHGRGRALVRPGSTEEVAALVRICAGLGVPIVPQGGNTGQVAGGVPDPSGRAIVLSLARMARIRAVDPANDTITVEAGCVLQAVQDAARAAGRLFPLSLGAEGSCTIGGNLATNAGGTQVLRYGNARELTLGLEVVLADGEIWSGLRGLRKDNSGYDLRDLFVGSEGTLGIITAATLRLFPLPRSRVTALASLGSIEAAGSLLARCRTGFDAALTAFELISGPCLRLVASTFPDLPAAMLGATEAPWYVLVERSGPDDEESAHGQVEAVLEAAFVASEVSDATLARSLAQSRGLWRLRESITLALAADGKCLKHDISLPVSAMTAFVEPMQEELSGRFPGVRPFIFGHLGDGNLHYNIAHPLDDPERLQTVAPDLSRLVHDAVDALGGSISAEQGIGRVRAHELGRYKTAVELRLMRSLKAALDPDSILNPGVLLPP